MIRPLPRTAAVLLALLALAACGGGRDAEPNLDTLDNELLEANAADPAVTAALQDQIMVDPSLAAQANGDAVRPPARPYSGAAPGAGIAAGSSARDETLDQAPAGSDCKDCKAGREALTLGELARAQQRTGGTNGGTAACATKIGYSAQWATRLPAALALHPDARVAEAAGTDADGCRLRVVSYTVAQPLGRMVDWYYTRARRAGYSAEHQADGDEHVVGGTRGNAAYVVYLSPQNGRTAIDLVVDGG